MKTPRTASHRWHHLLKQRFHGKASNNMPELIGAEAERTEIELDNIRRWEDDGGPVLETGNSFLQVPEHKTSRPMEVAGRD